MINMKVEEIIHTINPATANNFPIVIYQQMRNMITDIISYLRRAIYSRQQKSKIPLTLEREQIEPRTFFEMDEFCDPEDSNYQVDTTICVMCIRFKSPSGLSANSDYRVNLNTLYIDIQLQNVNVSFQNIG
ncbi:hypothetical protein RCL_jg4978.t1 [Rhizophagus clarus]|uniref:Uncharacterized protein n=1 Tax=Rhizophagus clarus TaxID=94130 RepID=A0A8H3QJT7_9GLOM|nr:hypothetical protein RCL_jg4978.t1 [Rhizophagus clarus]